MHPTATPLPPNPCLVAILLVVKTGTGPRIVFHYPPIPSVTTSTSSRNPSWYGTPGTLSDQSDSSDSDSSADTASGGQHADGSSKAASRSSGGPGNNSRRDATSSLKSGTTRFKPSEAVDEDKPERTGTRRETPRDQRRNELDGRHGGHGHEDPPDWEHILGFSSDGLGKLFCPSRASFNKKRFELGIDQLVFLGAPRFVRGDGLWKKKKRRTKRRDHSEEPKSPTADDDASAAAPSQPASRAGSMSSEANADYEHIPIFEAGYGHETMSGTASEIGSESRSVSTNGNGAENDLDMFNVVFVMNPPALEYHSRVDEMYDNVVKKLAKALKYAQATNNYVQLESRAIWAMKEKGKESHSPISALWSTIAKNSSLARAIMITFNTISHDKIAHVNLGQDLDASFQIPQAVSISCAPTPIQPQMPGLWLTTATPWEDDESDTLSPHSALLLLEDEDVLLKEVESDSKELSGPLSYFVRNLTPEKSLLKISYKSSLTLQDVQVLARHLIYWRRGRAIPPLRERDTYIVSPNADMRSLKKAAAEFAGKFPTLPSLHAFLNTLSTGTPRPWHHLLPTRDHRSIYMRILAWLMRYGWVTQLRTFGWVRVPPEVKSAVAAIQAAERRQARSTERGMGGPPPPPQVTAASDRTSDVADIERASFSSHLTREISADRAWSPRPPRVASSDTGSVSSGQTAVTVVPPFSPNSRATGGGQHLQKLSPLTVRHSPLQGPFRSSSSELDSPTSSSTQHHHHQLGPPVEPAALLSVTTGSGGVEVEAHGTNLFSSSIIHSPQKASEVELRWIEHIGARFEDNETKDLWPVLLKYFDGKHAFEEIHVREGRKNKDVVAFLQKLSADGWLLTVKHW
jgi:hypothetical protein